MKKAVYLTCLIFSLVFLGENINFMYAQLENGIKEVQTEENLDTDLNNSDNESQEESIEKFTEEFAEENENIWESYIEESNENKQNMDDLDIEENDDWMYTFSNEDREINVYDVEQVIQEIDTSEYWIIRITDPSNPWKWITIHDRNLWAVTTWYWTNAPDTSYWYYYQWGNNYGFPTTWVIKKIINYSVANINALEFWPDHPYSSDTFIKWNVSDWASVSNGNLWWWGEDNEGNNRWLDNIYNTFNQRQWPCPIWYHIPSIWEWSKLLEFWAYEYTWAWNMLTLSKDTNNSLNKFSDQLASSEILKRLNIPISRQRNNNSIIDDSNLFLLWASSQNGSSAFRLFWQNGTVSTSALSSKINWIPIRCFYNSYWLPVIITYDINWWYWYWTENWDPMVITYTKTDDESNFIPDIELWIPKRLSNCWENGDKKCMFAWWYTLIGDEIWTWDLVEDITVYAKWLPFEDKDITLSRVNFTIMDRNLWAINPWTWESSYGYYLTWWEEDIVCPEWYHIPSTWEWLWINKFLGLGFDWNYIRDLLDLPFAGKIVNNEIVWTWEDGYYLAKNGDEIMYARINNSGIETKNIEEWEKVSARCFKDYNTWTIKFNTNGWDNIGSVTAVNWREKWDDLESPERENSIFSWWYTTFNFQEWTKIEKNINYKNEEQINVYAKWKCVEWYKENENQCEAIYFNIKWIDWNWNTLKIDSVKRWSMPIYNWETPIKNSDSNSDYTFNGKWLPEIMVATWDAEYIAQFDAEPIKKSGWGSSWWGWKSTKDNTHWSADLLIMDWKKLNNSSDTWKVDIISSDYTNTKLTLNNITWKSMKNLVSYDKYFSNEQSKWWNNEFLDAYNFAESNWIIASNSMKEANMYSPITRIEMAKMLSNYAINILWKEPDISKWIIKFNDVSNNLDSEYDNAVTKWYQLGIIWQNITNNNFRPNDEVTRAEFVTVLSRLLYWTEDWKWNIKYYEPHLAKLYNEWIINNTNPKIKEKRWYVMIMLMRSLEKI